MGIYLSLGSNSGNKEENILNAQSLFKVKKASKFFYSKALLPENAPAEWDMDFINVCMEIDFAESPLSLLKYLQEVEVSIGRSAERLKWSPRVIDIDIIFFDNLIMDTDELTIPHPEVHKRDFILRPLIELEDLYHPVLNKKISELINML